MFPSAGDFGLKHSLKEVEDDIIARFSLIRTEDKISSAIEEELQKLSLYDEVDKTPVNELKVGQLDFLPKQHLMETRAFERVLMSYNLPQYLTPNTTPVDIDLQDRRQRRHVLTSVLHEDQIWKHIEGKIPGIKILDLKDTDEESSKKKCNTNKKAVVKSNINSPKKSVKDCRRPNENSKQNKKQNCDSKKKLKSGLKLKVCTNFLHR